jgi:hypothetical protein
MTSVFSWHNIAAQRGDGLRPEFAKLFERPRLPTDAVQRQLAIVPSGESPTCQVPVDDEDTPANPRSIVQTSGETS